MGAYRTRPPDVHHDAWIGFELTRVSSALPYGTKPAVVRGRSERTTNSSLKAHHMWTHGPASSMVQQPTKSGAQAQAQAPKRPSRPAVNKCSKKRKKTANAQRLPLQE